MRNTLEHQEYLGEEGVKEEGRERGARQGQDRKEARVKKRAEEREEEGRKGHEIGRVGSKEREPGDGEDGGVAKRRGGEQRGENN